MKPSLGLFTFRQESSGLLLVMPLYFNDQPIVRQAIGSTRTLFEAYPDLETASMEFTSKPVKVVSPLESLHVLQREFAIVSPGDKSVSVVGTSDMTTCCAVILKHNPTGLTAVAHFDGCETEKSAQIMINRILRLAAGHFNHGPSSEDSLDLFMVGSYVDGRKLSELLCQKLLSTFNRTVHRINLKIAAITQVNTRIDGPKSTPRPIFYSVAYDLITEEVSPVEFTSPGPVPDLRRARHFDSSGLNQEMIEIYDTVCEVIKIDPFTYEPLGHVEFLLKQPDEWIRMNFSTSPLVEPNDFVVNVRRTFQFMQSHPKPHETVFKDLKPLIFKKDLSFGEWSLQP